MNKIADPEKRLMEAKSKIHSSPKQRRRLEELREDVESEEHFYEEEEKDEITEDIDEDSQQSKNGKFSITLPSHLY